MKDWINQVYAQACIENEVNVQTATMTMTSGVASYTLDSSVFRIKQMFVTPVGGTNSRPLRASTLEQIITWRQANGGATISNGILEYFTLAGVNDLEVYPTPSGADVLTMWYVAIPTALSADADVPIIQEPYSSKVLEYGALAEAADFKGDPALQDYRQEFEVWKQKLRSHLTRKQSGQPGQFTMFPSNLFPPHDPSTDIRW